MFEIRKISNASLVCMYSPAQFLEHAKTYVKTKVSYQAVEEMREVSKNILWIEPSMISNSTQLLNPLGEIERTHDLAWQLFDKSYYSRMEASVYAWLRRNKGETVATDGFPDFIVRNEDGVHGYEVKFVRSLE